jgi:hypothetical protein
MVNIAVSLSVTIGYTDMYKNYVNTLFLYGLHNNRASTSVYIASNIRINE